jgi:hypothetical protein
MLSSSADASSRAAKCMAVLAAFADEGLGKPSDGDDDTSTPPPLGAFEQWPIFMTRDGSCVAAKRLRWPEDDFWRAPMAIQALLEPHILPPRAPQQRANHGGKGRGGRHGHRNQAPPPQQESGSLLDSSVQRMLQAPPANSVLPLNVWKSAVQCVTHAKTIENTTVSMDAIVRRFFEARSRLSASELQGCATEIITVTAWAQQRRMAHRVNFVLVGDTTLRLVPPAKVYIGSPYTETRLAELAGDNIATVSPLYDRVENLAVSTPSTRQWRDFFLSIGVNDGVRFEARFSTLQRSDHMLLPDKAAPKVRKSVKSVVMPYGLGTMNSRQLLVIDVDLSPEWVALLQQLGRDGLAAPAAELVAPADSPAVIGGIAFARLLTQLQLDVATHPDAKSTPAAGPAIAGRESDPAAASLRLIPTRRRLIYLPPGQVREPSAAFSLPHATCDMR